MPQEIIMALYTAIGVIFLYCKWGRERIRTFALSEILDLWTTEQTTSRMAAELIIFVVLGCIVAIGVVDPDTPPQALTAGLGWTGLMATAK